MTEEEWKVVTNRNKRRVMRAGGKRRPVIPQVVATTQECAEGTEPAVLGTMSKCRRNLLSTDFYQNLRVAWDKYSHKVEQIVCYGIGSLSTSPSASMWQLACVLTIQEMLQGDGNIPLFFYDPCTTPFEASMLQSEWKIQVLSRNERGKRPVNGLTTLFFMPHCPLRLYDNVLWANWNALEKVILFGNSLLAYSERSIEKLPMGISRLLPLLTEERVHLPKCDIKQADGNLEGAFNDCYLTCFSVNEETVLPPQPMENLHDNNDEVI